MSDFGRSNTNMTIRIFSLDRTLLPAFGDSSPHFEHATLLMIISALSENFERTEVVLKDEILETVLVSLIFESFAI